MSTATPTESMGVSMMVIFPLTFLSNVFVGPKTMPGWLQVFVNNSPITHLASAVRELMAGDWPTVEIAWSLGWSALFVLVFGPVTMRLYNRKQPYGVGAPTDTVWAPPRLAPGPVSPGAVAACRGRL